MSYLSIFRCDQQLRKVQQWSLRSVSVYTQAVHLLSGQLCAGLVMATHPPAGWCSNLCRVLTMCLLLITHLPAGTASAASLCLLRCSQVLSSKRTRPD